MSNARALSSCIYLALFTSITWSLPMVPASAPCPSPVYSSRTTQPENMNTYPTRQDPGFSESMAKRDDLPLCLFQYNTTSITATNPSILNGTDNLPIPHTPYSLRLSMTGSYMYLGDIQTLLSLIRDRAERELITHGRNARLSSSEYSADSVGLRLWVQKMPWETENLAWAELAVIIDGLWLYILEEEDDRETFFELINDQIRRQVAFGWIGKPHVPLQYTWKNLQK